MALTDYDVMRLDEMFGRAQETRERRGYIPDRDEDKIAEILGRADEAARVQRELLVDSGYGFGSSVRFQEPVATSESTKEFETLSRWKNREVVD